MTKFVQSALQRCTGRTVISAAFSMLAVVLAVQGVIGSKGDAMNPNSASMPTTGLQRRPADVVAAASRFLKSIGQPGLGLARVVYVGRASKYDEPYFQLLWRVGFRTGPSLLVSDATGSIVSFAYGSVSSNIARFGDAPRGVELSQDEAIERAESIIHAAGINRGELATPFARIVDSRLEDPTRVASFGDRSWQIYFDRTKSGMLYEDQRVVLLLQSETGQLIDMMVKFPTPPAISTRASVSRQVAIARAEHWLKHSGLVASRLRSASLVLASHTASSDADWSTPPTPCWKISFGIVGWGPDDTQDVNVDAVTAHASTGNSNIAIRG